ncbi:hypothetical protein FQN60_004410 [Etheostoma spectabile]|uniref:Uncharacterized protein n=1 Tax=Etheostoma spectabile TaxID=54343 RepID=A0A5J5CYE3_9PERO|nr:hypothetical protein FQN60_004410 [Etheostoma spectabile]
MGHSLNVHLDMPNTAETVLCEDVRVKTQQNVCCPPPQPPSPSDRSQFDAICQPKLAMVREHSTVSIHLNPSQQSRDEGARGRSRVKGGEPSYLGLSSVFRR